jgi:hypothetical protein
MQEEQAMSIVGMLVKGDLLMQIVYLGSNIIWLIIACTLYQIFRLSFLKFFVAESILSLVAWLWHNRPYFFNFPDGVTNDSYGFFVCFWTVDFLIRNAPILIGLIGSIMGLRYLQTMKKSRRESSAT